MQILQLLQVLVGVASLVCFVLVLIKMFQHNQTALGITCIVLIFVCGIGGLVAFIMGWVNVKAWKIDKVMIAWTVSIVVGMALGLAGGFTMPALPR